MLQVLGKRVRNLRKQAGMSQRELCAKAGLSVRFLVQLEGGTANVSVQRLSDLCDVFQISLATLFHVDDLNEAKEHELVVAFNKATVGQQRRVSALLGLAVDRKVSLIGLRGAGKSTIGKQVSQQKNWSFVELDERIRQRVGMSLRDLFEYHGMERYRQLRQEVLEEVLGEPGDAIIEIGGSVVLDDSAFLVLRERTQTVWLKATPYDHLQRVKEQGDNRPMAGRMNPLGELRSILEEREPLYATANHMVNTSKGTLQDACGAVLQLL